MAFTPPGSAIQDILFDILIIPEEIPELPNAGIGAGSR
jgi:hypothetical protein